MLANHKERTRPYSKTSLFILLKPTYATRILNLSYAQNANTYFEKIRNNEAQLTAFLLKCPKERFAPSF
jgi:hypothetical protein